MMQEPEQNRTEKATPFKLSEAKRRGQAPKSLDFNALVMVWGLLAALSIWGAAAWRKFLRLSGRLLDGSAAASAEGWDFIANLARFAGETLTVLSPFFGIGVILAIAANLVQTGPVFSFEPLKPKFDRLNPVSGFKRIYNKQMLFQALKSVLKLGFLGLIVYGFLAAVWPQLPLLENSALQTQIDWLQHHGMLLFRRLGLALLVVGALDLAFVRWQFGRQMMMSRREMKEEVKRREGDPQIRAKLRELQRENLKQSRSLGRVSAADVLITNPNHVAVALQYARGRMSAPQVIAKGSEAWVVEMKALARKHGVPIHERRGLARKLFRLAAVDRPIPAALFVDVARVYADLEAEARARNRYEVRT